ncbi:hypothetical protein [Streptosporangium sp. NPDC002544]
MRKIARLYTLILTAAVPVLLALQTGTATAEAIRIANHCEPSA